MSALGHCGPAFDVVHALGPVARRENQLAGEQRDCRGRLDSSTGLEAPRMMTRFVVEAGRGIYRLRHPVDRDVGEHLIFSEALLDVTVAIAPGAELLDDPRRQSRRRIVQAVSEGL